MDGFKRDKLKIESLGANQVNPVHWHKTADLKGYVEVSTDTSDTQVIVHVESGGDPKYTCRAWMYKHGQPVAMLKFSTYEQGYTFPQAPSLTPESIINTVEVHPEHSGNGYSLAIIREVEKNVLGGRLIHSGGSYTPEGRAALGGKLPYTAEAKRDQEISSRYNPGVKVGDIPTSTFDSMRFVGDWDTLYPEVTWED